MTAMDEHTDDMLEGLEERLQSHNKAFESLLALTPAREYFGSQIVDGLDPSEQWTRKKQTKEQKKAAKQAKLDPANQMSALDVMKERERKRKRELGMDEEDSVTLPALVEPKDVTPTSNKRQKVELSEEAQEAKRKAKAGKRKEKRDAKKEKSEKKKAKSDAKKAAKQGQDVKEVLDSRTQDDDDKDDDDEKMDDEVNTTIQAGELDSFDASGLAGSDHDDEGDIDAQEDASSVPSSPAHSPAFDISANHSTASSSSSIVPPSEPAQRKQTKQNPAKLHVNVNTTSQAETKPRDPPSGTSSPKIHIPNIDQAELQERLRQRIEELRAKRKADGPDGKPVKSRQDLLEQRRRKDEQRKAAKKEQRRKAKEEEARKQEAQLRGSGSPLSREMFGNQSTQPENNFSFSRLAFQDGSAADAGLTTLSDPKHRKGRSDPKTALEAAQNKQKRIAGYDAEKQADIAEKDLWLNAKKRAHGEKVRDDTSLLKKALKRKEKEKGKSETAWQERVDAVVHGKEMKQKKREKNLAKRKEDKGGKKGKGGAKSGAAKGGKKKGRPGFEGRFKA